MRKGPWFCNDPSLSSEIAIFTKTKKKSDCVLREETLYFSIAKYTPRGVCLEIGGKSWF